MPRPLSLLPALVAVAAIAAAGVVAAPEPAAAAVESDDPLQVTIDSLTPSEVPRRGKVRVAGTITNVSEDRWRAINVHAFVGTAPLTTSAELIEAADVPSEVEVGDRITLPGTFDTVDSLEPGESAAYSVTLRRDELPVEAPGVYWFGIHALGNTEEARDGVADGRARTFLPLVSPTPTPIETALVIPIRRAVQHTRSGTIFGPQRWGADLAPGGPLRALADLGAAARSRPITWLVDPAVPDAVRQLVAGNPPRSLADTLPEDEDEEPAEPDPSEEESSEPATFAAADISVPEVGADWLDRLEAALSGERVLALPYGDTDVSAATDHSPGLLEAAQERTGERLQPSGLPVVPAVAPPAGYLSPEAVAGLAPDTLTLLSEQVLPAGRDATVLDVEGRQVLFASAAVSAGGPGPDDPLAMVAMRQRILAEAAVRLLAGRESPLVVLLPHTWAPDRPRAFFRGLGVEWLDLVDATTATTSESIDADRIDYPPEQRAEELPAANFTEADALLRAGLTLANVLTRNDLVDEQVADEALTSVSYGNRAHADAVRERTAAATRWLNRRLGAVRVRAPRGVTLASAAGGFAATVTNRLEHPVTVSIKAITDAALAVDTPQTLDLTARGSQTVVLDARATTPGVHYVRLVVTDDSGTPLGSSATVPVRSAQVSEVIWLILAVGVGLLFLAIAVRLVRRIRSERA